MFEYLNAFLESTGEWHKLLLCADLFGEIAAW
jgi:hypothetical protein